MVALDDEMGIAPTAVEGHGDELGERATERLRPVTSERRSAVMEVGREIDRRAHRCIIASVLKVAGVVVKLTVIHDDFAPDSEMLRGVRDGWPAILSNPKSLLERGETLSLSPRLQPRRTQCDRRPACAIRFNTYLSIASMYAW